jgi:alpha-1,2-mannosyltransferase
VITSVARARDGRYLLVAAIVLEILAIWFVHWIDTRGYMDTGIYRLGARAWVEGYAVYGDDLTPESPDSGTLPFIYPPFAALLFVPLTWMSEDGAIVTVAALSHVSILVTAYSLARSSAHLAPRAGLVGVATAVVMPFVTLVEPARDTLNYGQINLVLMGLVAADCLLPRTRWPRGLLVGVAAAIKLTPLGFVLLFFLRRDFRAAAIAAVTFAATVLVGMLAAPEDSADWWLDKMLSTGDSFGTVYAGNLTLRSLLAKQELTGTALNSLWIGGSLVLVALAVLGMRYALRVGNRPLALMTNAVLVLLISPISWSHHWVWAAPTLALLFAMSLRNRWWGVMFTVGICTVTVMIGPQWYLPYTDDKELGWTFSQQVVGNAYTLIGMGFLVAGAVAWFRFRPKAHAPADRTAERAAV